MRAGETKSCIIYHSVMKRSARRRHTRKLAPHTRAMSTFPLSLCEVTRDEERGVKDDRVSHGSVSASTFSLSHTRPHRVADKLQK